MGAKLSKQLLRDCDNVFYYVEILLSYQAMSSPQLSRSQLDPSLTSGVHSLIAPFSSLSIESHRDKEVVQSRAVTIPRQWEFLLQDDVYFSAAQVVRKRQRTFWAFAHGEEIIKKWIWLCGLCKEVGKIQLYSSTSTAWMGEHLTKRHNLSKPTTTGSHSSLASQIESTTPVIKENARSPFIPITPTQYSNFRLMLITWIVRG